MYTKNEINEILKEKYPELDFLVNDAVLEDIGFFNRQGDDNFDWDYYDIKDEWVIVKDKEITITEPGFLKIDGYIGLKYEEYLLLMEYDNRSSDE